jgi:acyl-coenzyme A thioesterase 9
MQTFRKPKLSQFHHIFRFTLNSLYPFNQTKSLSTDSKHPKSTSSSLPNPIDAGSSNRKPISLWPGMHHSPATHALWEARSTIFEKPINGNSNCHDPSSLDPKSPSQSRTSILYNFSSDLILREQYRNPWNHIRMGKLVEDFDALAGTIALKVFSFSFFFLKLDSGFCLL